MLCTQHSTAQRSVAGSGFMSQRAIRKIGFSACTDGHTQHTSAIGVHFDMLALAYIHTNTAAINSTHKHIRHTHTQLPWALRALTYRQARARTVLAIASTDNSRVHFFFTFLGCLPFAWARRHGRRKPTPLFLSLAGGVYVCVCEPNESFPMHVYILLHADSTCNLTALLESMWKSTARGLGSFSYFKLVLRSLLTSRCFSFAFGRSAV